MSAMVQHHVQQHAERPHQALLDQLLDLQVHRDLRQVGLGLTNDLRIGRQNFTRERELQYRIRTSGHIESSIAVSE